MRKINITGTLLAVIIIILLYAFLGKQPLYLEEQRRAVVAQEMAFSGNYLVPTVYGEIYQKKPPVWNWVLIGAFRLFGNQSEFSLRFFAVLSFLLTGFIVYLITNKHFGRRTAWLSALLFLTSADIFLYFSLTAEIDLFYSYLIFSMLALIYELYHQHKWLLMFTLVYGIGSIAFLTKGMPTLLFIGLSFLAIFLMEKNFRKIFCWQHFVGGGVFLVIVGGYIYLYSLQADPRGLLEVLWSESSQRTAGEQPASSFFIHLFTFPIELIKNLAPVSLLGIVFIRHSKGLWKSPWLRYAMIITAVNILVYWLSPGTKQRYVYMLYPFLVIILVAAYERVREGLGWEERFLSIAIRAIAGVLIALMLVFPWLTAATPLPNRLIASACGILILAAGYYFFMIRQKDILLFMVILMIAIRLVVNLTWTEYRGSPDNPVMVEKASGEYLASLPGDEGIRIIGESEIPLRVAYYAYRNMKTPITVDRRPQPGFLYLSDSLQLSRQESLEILKTLPLQDGREMYLGVVPDR